MALVESALRKRLEGMFGSPVQLIERARVTGRLAGQILRDCEVLIFAIPKDPEARCYAWEAEGRVKLALGASDGRPSAMTQAHPRASRDGRRARVAPQAELG